MSSTAIATATAPVLCKGADIGYKAFARYLMPDSELAVLILVANCYFGSSGYGISIQPTANGFELIEHPPTGIFHDMVTYYVGTWASAGMMKPPSQVTITDGFGDHQVPVHTW